MESVIANNYLSRYARDSYAREADDSHNTEGMIDCALGINPYGSPPSVQVPLRRLLLERYPAPDPLLVSAIATRWSSVANLSTSNVQLECGAFGVIERIGKLLIEPGCLVLGYSPQFPDFAGEVSQRGGRCDFVALRPEDGYRFNAEDFITYISEKYRLIYIDNPNNPTGQVIPLWDLESIVKTAEQLRIAVLVDEAYGEFMPDECSAIGLIRKYDNLFVARSFSKGWGLPGLRAGYAVMSDSLLPLWRKIDHPFPVSGISQNIAGQALLDDQFIDDCVRRIARGKISVLDSCRRLEPFLTDNNVPIFALRHPDSGVDLCREFSSRSVHTFSASHFVGLDQNSVRIRIPVEVDALVRAIESIEHDIK
ncbi:MAG: histidinol-phosphate transaminase [Herbaspirillum sp.]